MKDTAPTVTLFSVHGCHLCDSARLVILETRRDHPFRFEETVLDDQDPRIALHGDYVPVIFVNGREIAHWRITSEQLLNALT